MSKSGSKSKFIVLLILLIVVVAIFVAVPYFIGGNIKGIYETAYSDFEKSPAPFTLVERSFKRGINSSSAKSTFDFQGEGPMVFRIIETDEIKHGFTKLTKPEINGELVLKVMAGDAEVFSFPPMKSNFVVSSILSGGCDIKGTFNMARLTPPAGMPIKVDWNGFSGNMDYKCKPKSLKFNMTATPLTATLPDGTFSISNISSNWDLNEGPSEFLIGKIGVNIGTIEGSGRKGNFKADMIKVISESKANGKKLDGFVTYSLGEVTSNGKKYGPGVLKANFKNFYAPALKDFRTKSAEFNKKKIAGGDNQKLDEEMQKVFIALLSRLANKVPSIEISEASLVTPDGKVDANIKVVLDGSSVDLAKNPLMAMSAITVDGRLRLPESIVSKAASTPGAPNLIDGDYLTKDGSFYTSTISFKNGSLNINGVERNDLMSMMGAMAGGAMSGGEWQDPNMKTVRITPQGESVVVRNFPPAGQEWVGFNETTTVRRARDTNRVKPRSRPYWSEDRDTGELINALTSRRSKWIVRNEAARGLAVSSGKDAVNALVNTLLSDQEPFVRREAALSLGEIGDRQAVGALRQATSDEDGFVRLFAEKSLKSLEK